MVGTVAKDVTTEPERLLERSRSITVQGGDKEGLGVVRIVGKYFPGKIRLPHSGLVSDRICSRKRRLTGLCL